MLGLLFQVYADSTFAVLRSRDPEQKHNLGLGATEPLHVANAEPPHPSVVQCSQNTLL